GRLCFGVTSQLDETNGLVDAGASTVGVNSQGLVERLERQSVKAILIEQAPQQVPILCVNRFSFQNILNEDLSFEKRVSVDKRSGKGAPGFQIVGIELDRFDERTNRFFGTH